MSGNSLTTSTGGATGFGGSGSTAPGITCRRGSGRRGIVLLAARWTARPELRTIAPIEAPLISSAPTSSVSTPAIATPVEPIASASPPPSTWPS